MVLSAGLIIVVMRALFPAGRLFPIAFASLIAVYAAIFSLFVEEIFPSAANSSTTSEAGRQAPRDTSAIRREADLLAPSKAPRYPYGTPSAVVLY